MDRLKKAIGQVGADKNRKPQSVSRARDHNTASALKRWISRVQLNIPLNAEPAPPRPALSLRPIPRPLPARPPASRQLVCACALPVFCLPLVGEDRQRPYFRRRVETRQARRSAMMSAPVALLSRKWEPFGRCGCEVSSLLPFQALVRQKVSSGEESVGPAAGVFS